MLNDRQIRELQPAEPWDESLVQPASLDVRLGSKILVPKQYGTRIVIGKDVPDYDEKEILLEGYPMLHGAFILAHTLEKISLPSNVAGKLEGKSSLGRLGLMTHITAGFIDPGFDGDLTLELSNAGPYTLILRTGIKIGQIAFFRLDEPAEFPYGSEKLGSHYQNSEGVVGMRI